MSTSKCVKCENSTFEMVANTPKGSKFQVMFIQCTECGTVVGVQSGENIPALLHFMQDTQIEMMQKIGLSTRYVKH